VAYKAPSQLPLARAGWGDSQAQAVGLNGREHDERWGFVLIGQVALCICSKGGLNKSQANVMELNKGRYLVHFVVPTVESQLHGHIHDRLRCHNQHALILQVREERENLQGIDCNSISNPLSPHLSTHRPGSVSAREMQHPSGERCSRDRASGYCNLLCRCDHKAKPTNAILFSSSPSRYHSFCLLYPCPCPCLCCARSWTVHHVGRDSLG